MRRAHTDRDYGVAPPRFRLPDDTHLGRIRLQVSDLSRSVAYYQQQLGFHVTFRDAHTAWLHTAARDGQPGRAPLIVLHQRAGTKPIPRHGTLGLYHFAILLPDRASLGRFVKHLVDGDARFGSADHLVSEAIYLWDPDGLGIEVYVDRPADSWQANGRELMMATDRLDLRSLIDAGGEHPWQGMPAGTTLGHMHLSVGDLDAARRFYHEALGLELTVWSYPGALFMSAGGYHHHLAANTWAAGARAASEHDARLLDWELVLPHSTDVQAAEDSLRAAGYATRDNTVTDPWGTQLKLVEASVHFTASLAATQTRDIRPELRRR